MVLDHKTFKIIFIGLLVLAVASSIYWAVTSKQCIERKLVWGKVDMTQPGNSLALSGDPLFRSGDYTWQCTKFKK